MIHTQDLRITPRFAVLLMTLLTVSSLSCDTGSDRGLKDARALVSQGEGERALAREALASNDQDATGKHIAAAQKLFIDARDAYLQAHLDQSRDPVILDEFAVFATRNEDYDLTAKAYRRAAEFSPDTAMYWLAAGINFVRVGAGMADEALESLDMCIKLATASGDEAMLAKARGEMGHLHRMLGLYELSREDYALALGIDSALPRVQMGLAALDFREGKVRGAASRIDALGSLESEDAAYLESVLHFGYTGFRKTRGWFPDTAQNHLAYARLLTRMQRYPDALYAVQRASELDDRDIVTMNLLGSLARLTGDTARATRAFERSLLVDPNQPRTREVLKELNASPPIR